ncbi:hypothetical protein I552_6956 [Mycobacterium xenopi 3993]|nr:hypothetical protein I552_6956 [Mycobacterium xenopi 3993]
MVRIYLRRRLASWQKDRPRRDGWSLTCCFTPRPGGLVVALSALIVCAARLVGVSEFPVVVAVLFALVLGMPLGIWIFGALRRRATAGLATVGERRRRDREQLRARLRGDVPPE